MTDEPSNPPRRRLWPIVLAIVLGVLLAVGIGLAIAAPSIATSIARSRVQEAAQRAGWQLDLQGLEISPWTGDGSLRSMTATRGDLRIAARTLTFHADVTEALGSDAMGALRSASAESFSLKAGARTQTMTQMVAELGPGATWATRCRSLRGNTELAGRPVPFTGTATEGRFEVTAGPVEVPAGSYQVLGIGADAIVRAEAVIELREEGAAVQVSTRPRATVNPSNTAGGWGALLNAAGAMLGSEVGVGVQPQSELVAHGKDLFAILGVVARQLAALPDVPR